METALNSDIPSLTWPGALIKLRKMKHVSSKYLMYGRRIKKVKGGGRTDFFFLNFIQSLFGAWDSSICALDLLAERLYLSYPLIPILLLSDSGSFY